MSNLLTSGRMLRTVIGLSALIGAASAMAGERLDVREFGAAGDGKAIDSEAINKAIEAAAGAGGGTVQLSAGNYLSFSIRLKSNVTLLLDEGATIIAATPGPDGNYDALEPNPFDTWQDRGHGHSHNSLIYGDGVENIAIVGKGKILGTGLVRGLKKPTDTGDKAIALKSCRNVTIQGITIQHGGHFGILSTGSQDVTIDHVTIDTNRDGIDIDSSQKVRITNCTVNAPLDDGICLKSSFALGEARATEDVEIRDCHLSGYDEGTLLDGTKTRDDPKTRRSGPVGRIKLGTESNGGFKNITIADCTFIYCRGLALETVDGGTLEDVTVRNITMQDIADSPIFLRLGARMRGPSGKRGSGALRRVSISGIRCKNAKTPFPALISGTVIHPVEDVTLSDIELEFAGGGTKLQATTQPTESERVYPDPSMFGDIPAYGLYVRDARNVRVEKMKVTYKKADQRPAVMLDRVKGAVLSELTAQHPDDVPVVRLKQSKDVKIEKCDSLKDTTLSDAADETF